MFVYVIISLLSIEKTLPQNGSFFDTKVSGRKGFAMFFGVLFTLERTESI